MLALYFCGQKRGNFSTNNKSKEFKPIPSLSKIQYGKSKIIEKINKGEGPNIKTGSERCIFQYSTLPSLKEIWKILMERKSVRIYMSLLWVIPIQVLRRMKVRLTFYLDDILVLKQTLNIILKARDTIIYIL